MSLSATKLQNWRIKSTNMDKNMFRPSQYGALDLFVTETMRGGGIISRELKAKAEASIGNTIQIPVIDYDGNVVVSNVRTCIIQDDENTSALMPVTFATYQVGFTMTPALYGNNEITYEEDFARKIEKVSRALANALDVAAIAALEANKTQVFAELLYYTESGDSVQVGWDFRNDFFGDLNTIMAANDYNGQLHIVGNYGVKAIVEKMKEHGLYNDVNKQFEYGDKVFHFTKNLSNGVGKFGTFYAVEEGNVGMLTRFDSAAFRNAKSGQHEWGKTTLPYFGMPVGYHYYEAVGDQSGIAGEASAHITCDIKEYWGFSIDVAFLVAYNSDPETIANPIVKGEIGVSAATNPMAMPVVVTNSEDDPVATKEVSE